MVKGKAVPPEARADLYEIEAYFLQYMARRWHIGDPLADLGSAVRMCLLRFAVFTLYVFSIKIGWEYLRWVDRSLTKLMEVSIFP